MPRISNAIGFLTHLQKIHVCKCVKLSLTIGLTSYCVVTVVNSIGPVGVDTLN